MPRAAPSAGRRVHPARPPPRARGSALAQRARSWMDGRVSTDGGHPATVGPPRCRPTAPLVSLSVAGPPLPFPLRPPSAPRGQLLGWSCMEDLLGDRCQCLAVTQLPRGGRRPPCPGLWNRTDLGWIPSSLLTLGKLSVRGGPVCLRVKQTPPVPWHFGAVRSVACGAGRPAELCPQRTAGGGRRRAAG